VVCGSIIVASGPPELFAAVFVAGAALDALEAVFETGGANFDAVCIALGGAGGEAFGSTFTRTSFFGADVC